jgi:predicted DNA-binding ribbon-helix-helix protein
MGVNIPKEQNMQALAKWLKVDPRWLRYGGVLEDSFFADFMSLSEEDKATVRAVVDAMCASRKVARLGSSFS